MPHLNEEQLATLAFEDSTDPHLDSCVHCRRRLGELREGLELARADEVPEPDAVTLARLHRSVMEEVRLQEQRRNWLLWPGLAAAATLAIGVAISAGNGAAPGGPAHAPGWSALPPIDLDVGFAVLEGVAPAQEQLEPLAGCDDLASCLVGLNEHERLALVDELREELARRES